MTEQKTEKWSVMVKVSEHMARIFSDEELEIFAKVLAVYTIPSGIPRDEIIVVKTTNVITDQELLMAYVLADGVMHLEATYDQGRLYDGAAMTPPHASGKPYQEPAAPPE